MTQTPRVVPKTSPLAARIAKDICEQTKHDGELWPEWMADYIEQEAMSEMAEVLRNVLAELMNFCDEHDGHYAVRPETQASIETVLAKAGLL